jgi:hypothetical protein
MENPLLMSLCLLYVQKGWNPHMLSAKFEVNENQIQENMNLLVEKKLVAIHPIRNFQYIVPPNIPIEKD